MARADRIEIGGVARAHGIRGEIVIVTHDPGSTTLGEVATIFVGGDVQTVVAARFTHRGWLVALEGVVTRSDAERLQGLPVSVERGALALGPDDVLLADLVGCEVQTVDGSAWGVVASVDGGDHQDLLVIHCDGVERLLPLVDAYVTNIDVERGIVTVDPPQGLPESAVARGRR